MPTIRPATAHDADFLAWAILSASRSHVAKGWFDIVLARPDSECREFCRRLVLTDTRSWWHYSYFRIAEVDGRPAATLCAFRAGEAYPRSGAAIAEVSASLGFDATEQRAMDERGAYLFTCVFADADDLWTIENVATVPAHRGEGLAGLLIRDALREGSRRGASFAQITFLIGNEPAARAYRKEGFVMDSERRHPDFAAATGVPGLCRYLRRLEG